MRFDDLKAFWVQNKFVSQLVVFCVDLWFNKVWLQCKVQLNTKFQKALFCVDKQVSLDYFQQFGCVILFIWIIFK